jgi:hypothetical protein
VNVIIPQFDAAAGADAEIAGANAKALQAVLPEGPSFFNVSEN